MKRGAGTNGIDFGISGNYFKFLYQNICNLYPHIYLNIHHVYTQGEGARIKLQEKLQKFMKEFTEKYNIDLDYYDEDDLIDEEEEED